MTIEYYDNGCDRLSQQPSTILDVSSELNESDRLIRSERQEDIRDDMNLIGRLLGSICLLVSMLMAISVVVFVIFTFAALIVTSIVG